VQEGEDNRSEEDDEDGRENEEKEREKHFYWCQVLFTMLMATKNRRHLPSLFGHASSAGRRRGDGSPMR